MTHLFVLFFTFALFFMVNWWNYRNIISSFSFWCFAAVYPLRPSFALFIHLNWCQCATFVEYFMRIRGFILQITLTMHNMHMANSKQLDIGEHWKILSNSINMLFYNNNIVHDSSPWNQYSDIFKLTVFSKHNNKTFNIQRPWKRMGKKNHG